MTKTPLLLAVIAIVVGVVLLRFSLINGSEINHVPAHLPFPGSGFTAGEVFHLPTPGWFSLEVITPARDTDKALLHREQPPVLCNVSLEISGPDGFLRRVDISRFANSGWTRNWDIYFPGGRFLLPKSGDYTISLVNHGDNGIFAEHGALVQLTRFEATGPEVSYSIAGVAAYGCLLFAIGCALFAMLRRR